MSRPHLLLVLLLPLLTCTLCRADGLAQVVGYTSPIDKSVQQYGIYLPASPAPSAAGYPTVFHMHGYGWSVSSKFSDFQKAWADDHGWILINLNARGPQFYDGIGDTESRNVVADAHRRYGLDLSRLYLVGGSMGGTGAFRLGVRYPDLFAAAVGVDGWSDFREWHYHWYARTDQQSDIEEFQRPLLEAVSPLYWLGRARWGAIQASVSGRDNVVLPENGLLLYNALSERSQQVPGAYANRLFLDYDAGHGGSYRIEDIYRFFINREAHTDPPSFLCETPLLTHGRMYWGSMLRTKVQGAPAALESHVEPAAGGETARVFVVTRNLAGLAIHLEASPAAEAQMVELYVDGFRAYEGSPRTVQLQADFSPKGDLWGWNEVAEASAGPVKSPELEGPIGEAFKRPFVVAYGTAGTAAEVARNRREAQDFARGWNAFMVHYEAVQALPEERLSAADIAAHSLVIFGTEQSSALLRRANAARELPVHVRSDGIVVRDPQWGDRQYLGSQFGAFVCSPNPLTDGQYLVICRGQWATKPDGSARQGLEYDLEKLAYAYGDYVVFNTDQAELPHVLNVNNKPPVTCYEAGYFVEAGFFDQDWQPYRAATLDRVRALKVPTRLIHVERLRHGPDGLKALVMDAAGKPVRQARVTVLAHGGQPAAHSAVTDDEGFAVFPQFPAQAPCEVLNVMATGAEYDWQADREPSTLQNGVTLTAKATAADENGRSLVTVEAASDRAERVAVRLLTPVGTLDQPRRELVLLPGCPATASFEWRLPGVPAGSYRATTQVTAPLQRLSFTRDVFVTAGAWSDSPLRVAEMPAVDIAYGGTWQAKVRLANLGSEAQQVTVRVALPADWQVAEAQCVRIGPGEQSFLVLAQPPGTALLQPGLHPVRVSVDGHRGVTAAAEFTVK